MITDKVYRDLSDMVYSVESNKKDGYEFYDESGQPIHTITKDNHYYKILERKDAPSGMQMMAAIAVDKAGNVINNDIVFSYAGTDFNHNLIEDVAMADAGMVVAGINKIQAEEALHTTKEWMAQFKRDNPNYNFSVTGHSLGGYNALYVSAKLGLNGVVFNAPNPNNILSELEEARLRRLHVINYKDVHDVVGYGGGIGNSEYYAGIYEPYNVYVDRNNGLIDGKINLLEAHELSKWTTDKYGNIVDNKGNVIKYNKKQYQTPKAIWQAIGGLFSVSNMFFDTVASWVNHFGESVGNFFDLPNVAYETSFSVASTHRTRDFSDDVKQQLLALVSEVEQESIFDIAHWDIFYRIERLFSNGAQIEKNAQAIQDYYRQSIDIDGVTRLQIEKVFQEVYGIDRRYANEYGQITEEIQRMTKEFQIISESIKV